MLDVKKLKRLVSMLENTKVCNTKFNIKLAKNIICMKKFIEEVDRINEPSEAMKEYLNRYVNATGMEKVKIKQAYKNTIKAHKSKVTKGMKKLASNPIILDDFSPKELPDNLDISTTIALLELGLISEE